MRKIIFGIIWYVVIANLLGFLFGFIIEFSLSISGNTREAAHMLFLNLFHKYQPAIIIISLIITILGTAKGLLPGTKIKK